MLFHCSLSFWQFGRDRGSQELKPGSGKNRISKTVEGEVSQSAGFRFCVFIEASVLSELRWYYVPSHHHVSCRPHSRHQMHYCLFILGAQCYGIEIVFHVKFIVVLLNSKINHSVSVKFRILTLEV